MTTSDLSAWQVTPASSTTPLPAGPLAGVFLEWMVWRLFIKRHYQIKTCQHTGISIKRLWLWHINKWVFMVQELLHCQKAISTGIFSATESLPESLPLQEIQIPVIGRKQCACSYLISPLANITDQMICAGQDNRRVCFVRFFYFFIPHLNCQNIRRKICILTHVVKNIFLVSFFINFGTIKLNFCY